MESRHGPFSISFSKALIPHQLTAEATVEQGSSRACYQSNWHAQGTRFPLASWSLGGRRMLAGAGAKLQGVGWLTDLDVVASPTMAAVRIHGDNQAGRDTVNVQTTWFVHLAGYGEEIWVCPKYETYPCELAWEIAGPAEALTIEGFPSILCARSGNGIATVTAPRGQAWVWRLAESGTAPVCVEIGIQPCENNRGYVDFRRPVTMKLLVKNHSDRDLSGGTLTLFGLDEPASVQLDLGPGRQRAIEMPLDIQARRGIIPLAVRFSHTDGVGLGFRTIWAPHTVIESDQPYLDGMYAENLRSMVHRFTFNTWREDEPRYPCYVRGVFCRNIHTALIGLDEPERLWGWVRLWLMSLRSCGYMPESFPLVVPSLGEPDWLDSNFSIGNDGLGFALIQWGKLFLRADDGLRREMLLADLADLSRAANALVRFMHWDGRIDDHSESIDGIRTDKMPLGSPFAQSLCLAGAILVRRSLQEASRHAMAQETKRIVELEQRYADLADRLRAGLDKACEDGFFSDMTCDQGQLHPHTYTNLTAGMVLSDPDLGEQQWTQWGIISRTIEFNAKYIASGRPYRVLTCPYWRPHPGLSHNAYSQIAMILNCLALGREEQAGRYFSDLMENAQADSSRQLLSDPQFTVMDWTGRDQEFSRYIIPEGAVMGHDRIKINPGNGVNCSYFLYLVDRMIGITPRQSRVEICPRLAGQRKWAVSGYRTRLGAVDYRIDRELEKVSGECKAASPMTISLPIDVRRPYTVFVDDKPIAASLVAEAQGQRVVFDLPAGAHRFRVEVGRVSSDG
ncbi:MAG: hypothetical protein HQ546_01665 [Planctomycetes bacterium]|nr:hypothetical protein [Planctomycetota bacterium]